VSDYPEIVCEISAHEIEGQSMRYRLAHEPETGAEVVYVSGQAHDDVFGNQMWHILTDAVLTMALWQFWHSGHQRGKMDERNEAQERAEARGGVR
jgi:hypothetical protein